MKYQFNTKMVASLIATTLIVSGLAYAATTITSTSQTVVNNDIMSAAWFNDVNSKIANLVAKVTNIETNSLPDVNGKIANLNTKMTTVETKLSNVSTAQNRITGSCPTGKAIQSIAADGTVTCVSTGANPVTFFGAWRTTYWWETLDNTVTISCHKAGGAILVGNTQPGSCGSNAEGTEWYCSPDELISSVTLAPDCAGGQMIGQPPARVILRVTARDAGDWPDIGTTYVFGSGPGELAFNQEHFVWDYVSNGRNRLWLTVNTTGTVTNLRVRSEDYSSGQGGVRFTTEVQFVSN